MANNNKMNIIEALVQLRNDLKLWVANNLRVKLDKNLGVEAKHKILGADAEGNVTPTNITWDEPTETVILEEQEFTPFSKLLETYGCSVNYAIADITVGETYSVIWDGVATTCTAVQDGAYTSLVCDGKFSIDILNNMTILTAFADVSDTHTVGIAHILRRISMAVGDDFMVYSDGHAEVKSMGETDSSVATKQYVDNAVAASGGTGGSIIPEEYVTEEELSQKGYLTESDIDYPVDSVNGKTGAVELTASDVGALPADTTFASLPGAPDITQDPKDEVLYVVDESGNIIMQVDEDGLATTTVTVDSVVLNGADVQATYATKQYVDDAVASSGGGTGGGVSQEYVDNAVAQKSQVQFITWEADD